MSATARISVPMFPQGGKVDAARMLVTSLQLLLDRYGLEPKVAIRLPDGRVDKQSMAVTADDYRIGDLFVPLEGADLSHVANVTMMVEDVDQNVPASLTFTAECLESEVVVRGEKRHSASGGGLDPAQVLSHLQVLLGTAARKPDQPFAELDILTATERHQLLGDFNGSPSSYRATTLHEMFVEQARRSPQAIAMIDGDRSMTYRMLDAASNRVAHQLRGHVKQAGQIVAVSAPRSMETLTVKIGVMKAGAAFMYLPPDTPPSRTALLCRIAEPVLIVASRERPLAVDQVPQLVIEELLAAAVPDTPVEEIADESTAAYVLFTSGSTGEPKGVKRSHRMNTTRVLLEQKLYQLSTHDRHLMKSVPFFREFFWALATGGTVVIARPGGEHNDTYLIDLIRRQKITVCSFVPSMLRVLLTNPRFQEPALPIEHLFVAGEVLDVELESRLRALGLQVHVTYTLAEADYVSHRSGPPTTTTRAIDVGRPIDMRLYICDQQGRLRPPGFVGEMWTGGPGLADGYVNRRELSAERFVPNPFDRHEVPILFKTGDLGRYRRDGVVEFVGRVDTQVKVRGNRVEPTEVEQHLRSHDQVEDVVVAGLPDPQQGHVLVAYVVPKHATLDGQTLRTHLRLTLPDFMVPSYFVDVPQLPLLTSGKVDREALSTVLASRPPGLDELCAPEDELERRIATVWSRVLGVEEVGIDDSFLALGGDSLKAMLLRSALEAELEIPLRLATLLRCPTVREFATEVRGAL